MERWRELGYVPDSQGEEEEEEDLEALLLASQDEKQTNKSDNGRTAGVNEPGSLPVPVPRESEHETLGNKRTEPTTTQKSGRKREIGSSESQNGEPGASGPSKRQRRQDDSSQRKEAKRPAEQSEPFEPESSPDVLQMEDVVPRAALVRPSTQWKSALPHDEDEDDSSVLSTISSSLSSVPEGFQSPIPDAEESQQVLDGVVEKNTTSNSPDHDSDMLHISTKALLPDTDDVTIDAPHIHEATAEITPTHSRNEAPIAPQTDRVEPLPETPCNDVAISQSLEERGPQADAPRTFTNTLIQSEGHSSISRPLLEQPQGVPHSPPKYHGRALRPRTVLQEKPYQVELARYALFCKQQGIPFHMPKSREHLHEQQRQHGHRPGDAGETNPNEEESQEYLDVVRDGGDGVSEDDDEQLASHERPLEERSVSKQFSRRSSLLRRPSRLPGTGPSMNDADGPHDFLSKKRKTSHTYSRLHAPSMALSRYQQRLLTAKDDTERHQDVARSTTQGAGNDQSLIDLLNIPELPSSQAGSDQETPRPQETSVIALLNELDIDDFGTFENNGIDFQEGSPSQEPRSKERPHPNISQEVRGLVAESDPESEAIGEPDTREIVTISDNDPIVDPTAGSDSDTPDADTLSSSPNNDAPEPRDLQRLQKRIKGVLPASWVRLEMKLQQEKDKAMKDRERKRREATIAMKRARTDGKGVAQPITKGRRRSDAGKELNEQGQEPKRGFVPDFLGEDALEDSSDSEDNFAQPSAAAHSRLLADDTLDQLDLAGRPLDDGDIPEDNRIDYMLPPAHRGTRRSAPSDGERKRKKQARLGFEPAQGMMTDTSRPRPISSRHPSLHKTKAPLSSVGGGRQSTWRADSSTADASWVKTIPSRGFSTSTGGNLPTPSSSNKTTSSTSIRNQTTKLRQSRIDDIERTTTGQRGIASSAPIPRQFQRSASERSAPPALNAVSDGPSHHGAHANPASAPRRRQPLQKGRVNDYSARKGYVLTSGRRETLRPAGLENTALPIRLERDALKKVSSTNQSHIRGDTNVVQPILPGDAHASGDHGPSPVQANPQLQRYLYGDENDNPVWTAEGHDPQTLTTEREHIRHLPNHPKPREDGKMRDEDRVKTATFSNGPITQKSCRLKGLNNLDTLPTTNFGISHLPAGTYFHSSTIIGSGELASALNVDSRSLNTDCGYTVINHDSMSYRWSAWAEPVASDLANVFQEIRTVLSELCDTTNAAFDKPRVDRIVDLYRSAITYVSDKLFFIDSIDRKNFVGRCALFLHGNLQTRTSPPVHSSEKQGYEVLLRTLDMVFSAQIYKIAMIEPPLPEMESDVRDLMKRAAELVIMLLYSEPGQKDLDDVLKDTGVTILREAGIRNDHPYASALVTLLVLRRNYKWLTADVQHIIRSVFLPSTAHKFEVLNLERVWRLLLSTLPFTSFDERGTLEPDYDLKEIPGQWPIVIGLLAPVFSAYEDEVFVRSLDRYCRVLFCRCFHIITYWKWQNWQDILQYLFKFFSTRKLRNLPSEGLCGSPAFLTQLEKTPTLQVETRDSTFHVFLKIIGVSWHHMAKVYDQQKLQNFARRLIPLHERQFPKDESLNQQDLDELRNHHDLLSTLYWAIPEKFRFRVATIRWLVQPLNSHTEASLININSWLRLTRFKLSTDEDISGLTPFADWHSAFTKDMLKLHALARTEIEAQAVGNNRYSRELLDSVIEENQKQIETLLGTTLINMALALRAAPSINHARAILEGFPLVELLDRFHAINLRSSTVVCQVLDIISAFTATETCQTTSQRQAPIVIDKNDESQEEYGDWSAFAELSNEDLVTPGPGIHFLNDTVRPAILRLASRYFGDDRSSDESVLYRIIDCWVAVAVLLVRYGLRGWSTQLNQYNPESWTSLPWTDRTRKFTPYVLARLIEADHSVYTQCKQEILKHWISCIVERGSVLKHQHSLTSALLNVDRRSPLLANLPFSRVGTESYAIALEEFSQRRLSLISSVLSNMREHVTSLYQNKSPDYQTVNESYRELIETLMRVMKSNYQELGQGNQYVQGQYVGFAHNVVGFLQQHVQQICPLDSFFTDPKAFPLPADDPSYIAAKLLSYEVRLTDEKIGMQLVTFIQSVSERAAVDGQQTYFVDQLYSAVSQSLERTRAGKPVMLDIIVTSVLPGYMEASLKNPVAWLLVRPFLQSLARTFNDMLLHLNVYDQDDVSATIWTLSFFFSELDQSLRLLVDHPGLLDEPRILVTMISYLETVMASIPAIDYIARSTSDAQALVSYVQVFHQMALFAYSCLTDPATARAPDLLDLDGGCSDATPAILLNLREFATNELDSWLKSTWSHRGGRYYVRQGPRWEEVVVNPECLSLDVVRPAFVQTVRTFCSIISHYETFDTHFETDRPW